jgi:uncharacterized protein DUF4192
METTQPDNGRAGERQAARPARRDSESRLLLRGPGDVLAVVPHLLGFHPQRSFVVVGAGGPRARVELGFRYDLPDPPSPAAAAQIADHAVTVLAGRGLTTVIGVGYGPGLLVTPVADAFAAATRHRRLRLRELLRVDDGRYWSYLCASASCCPAGGVPFDYRSHPAAAAMTAAGLAAHTSREALTAAIAPLTGEAALAARKAIERASGKAAGLVARARREGGIDPLRLVIDEGRTAVRQAIRTYRDGGRITGMDELAWLIVVLVNLPVRDDAWAHMAVEHRAAHLRLWADLVRGASGAWLPAPAALLAFTAWQCGEGALANVALDQALAEDPRYSMALLLRDILSLGVPPSHARPPMTPAEVEQSYARAEGAGPGGGPASGRRRGRGRQGGREGQGGRGAAPRRRGS